MREPRAPRVDRRALGAAAEDAAAAWLEQQGLRLLLRNVRCRFGELDVVALQTPDVLVLAEVRLRSQRTEALWGQALLLRCFSRFRVNPGSGARTAFASSRQFRSGARCP